MMSLTKRIHEARFALIAAILLFVSSFSSAFTSCYDDFCSGKYGSFYTGVGLGFGGTYRTRHFHSEQFRNTSPISISTENDKNHGLGNWGPAGYFTLGYQTPIWCRFSLAVDGFILAAPKVRSDENISHAIIFLSPTQEQALNLDTEEDLFTNVMYGVSLKPGYQINPNVTCFGKVGYGIARAEYLANQLSVAQLNVVGSTNKLDTYDVKRHKNLKFVEAGLGFNIRTCDHISFSLGYTWSHFNSMSLFVKTIDTTAGQFKNRSFKVKPENEDFLATVVYHFTPSEPYCPGPKPCGGHEFYVGILANRENMFTNDQDHPLVVRSPVFNEAPRQTFFSGMGFSPHAGRCWGCDAFVGYGYTFCCGEYLGVEGYYDSNRCSATASQIGAIPANAISSQAGITEIRTQLIKLKHSCGIAFLPGYKISDDILVYFKVGFNQRHLQFKTILANGGTQPLQLVRRVVFNRNTTKNDYGYQLGIGFDLRVCDNLFLRNEYTYTHFSNVKFPRKFSTVLTTSGFLDADDRSFKVESGQYKIGLVYKFPAT